MRTPEDYGDEYPDDVPPEGCRWIKAEDIEPGARFGPVPTEFGEGWATVIEVSVKPKTVWLDVRGQAGPYATTMRWKPRRDDWLAVPEGGED